MGTQSGVQRSRDAAGAGLPGDGAARGSVAIAAQAVGALAIGAVAIGALAIGRLAIRRLAVRRARLRSVRIEELTVDRLRVGELIVADRSLLPADTANETPAPEADPKRQVEHLAPRANSGAAMWALLGLSILAALALYGDRQARVAETRYPPVGRFVSIDGVRLHHLSRGSGAPVILLHANGVVLEDFLFSIFDRVAAAHRAIAFDRPGYGYSGRPAGEPLTLGLTARLIHEAVQSLEIERPVLVGHSMGGSVALRYAVDYPDEVAGLVLLAPDAYGEGLSVPPLSRFTDTPVLGPLFLRTLLAPAAWLGAPRFTAEYFAPDSPPPGYTEMVRVFAMRPKQFRAFAEELDLLEVGLREQSRRYSQIRVPVAIVVGLGDQVIDREAQLHPLRRAIPVSRLVELENTGHAVHHTRPEAVMSAIRWVRQAGVARA